MRTCFSMDPLTIDPRKNGDPITSTFLFLIFEGLTRLKPDGTIELALAESVVVSEDQKTYVFHLRKAFWSDGIPLTAYDFEYSWKKALDPKFSSLFPQLFYPIKNAEATFKGTASLDEVGVQALDERTLRIELEHPTPYFLSLISFCNFSPIPKHVAERNPHWDHEIGKEIVSSGPFKVARWKKKEEIVCEKNPFYWDVERVSIPYIHISIINNPFAVLQLFDEQELDLVSTILCSIPLEALAPYRPDTLKLFPAGGTVFCSFNMQQYPFQNQNIRKAFSYSIDRDYMVSEISRCNGMPARRCLPSILCQSEEEILTCNPLLARRHLMMGLEELGIVSDNQNVGFRLFLNHLTLIFDASQLNWKIAQALQNQWKKSLGYVVRLESCDYKTYIQKLSKKDYSMGIGTWFAQYHDPMSIFERFTERTLPKNFPGYENPKFSEQVLLASRETNPAKRKKRWIEAESQFLDDMPLAPIYHFNHAFLCNPHLSGVEITAIGGFHFNRCISSPPKFPQFAVS